MWLKGLFCRSSFRFQFICWGWRRTQCITESWSARLAEPQFVLKFPRESVFRTIFLTLYTDLFSSAKPIDPDRCRSSGWAVVEAGMFSNGFVQLCVSASSRVDAFTLGQAVSRGCATSCTVTIATVHKAMLSETWPAGSVILGWVNCRHPPSQSMGKTFSVAINFQTAAPLPKTSSDLSKSLG